MGARAIPMPPQVLPTSTDEVLEWLVFLCLSSRSRGLGGHELAQCEGLLSLRFLTKGSRSAPDAAAATLRGLLRAAYSPQRSGERIEGDPDAAVAHLLGLSVIAYKQPRPLRRKLAAEAAGMNIDTFQRHYELALLRDVAHELWRLETTWLLT